MRNKTLHGWNNSPTRSEDKSRHGEKFMGCGERNEQGEDIYYEADEGVNFFMRLGVIGRSKII